MRTVPAETEQTITPEEALRAELVATAMEQMERQPDSDIDVETDGIDVACDIADAVIARLHLHASTLFTDTTTDFRTITGRMNVSSDA